MSPKQVIMIAGLLIASLLVLLACGANGSTPAPVAAGQSTPTAAPQQTQAAGTATPIVTSTGTVPPSPTAEPTSEPSPPVTPEGEQPVVGPSGHYDTVQISDDGTKHLIPLEDVRPGGPPKDGIPSIDRPQFVTAGDWDGFLANYDGDGLVIGVEVNGIRRAYPFQVLVWHEIVNDTIDGMPLLITYCPLCGTGITFVREIDGEPVEFGVSGKLYNSDLLMYDRKTDSLWSQITGTAVIGPLTGERLAFYPSEIMTWDDWRATYPDSEVLTRETGWDRDYDRDPYGNYYTDGSLWFSVSGVDARLHSKTRVTGVELDNVTFGAYPDEDVVEHGPVNDIVGNVPLLVVADPTTGNNIVVFEREVAGQTLTFSIDSNGDSLIDAETGTRWTFTGEAIAGPLAGEQLRPVVTVKGFWFAWYAFHQDTELWLPETDE